MDDPAFPALIQASRDNARLREQIGWLALQLARRKAVWDPMACAGCDHEPGELECAWCWRKKAESVTGGPAHGE